MTNRITRHLTPRDTTTQAHPLLKAERRLERDVEEMLCDMAFVLKMTQRVKTQILAERERSEPISV